MILALRICLSLLPLSQQEEKGRCGHEESTISASPASNVSLLISIKKPLPLREGFSLFTSLPERCHQL